MMENRNLRNSKTSIGSLRQAIVGDNFAVDSEIVLHNDTQKQRLIKTASINEKERKDLP